MVTSGLSGNEMYCLAQKGYRPGEVLVGNSVYSLGLLGSFVSGVKNFMGGEVHQVTEFISEGRLQALMRLEKEAAEMGEAGITDVSSELIHHASTSNIEFLSVGSGIHKNPDDKDKFEFSTSIDASELYCNIDAGYMPRKIAFGNVAYAIGAVGGIMGGLKTMFRGEIHEYSNILNHTRHLALERIVSEAKEVGVNAVLNIETRIMPYSVGITEMLMIGTASHNDALPTEYTQNPITSDLSSTELWSLTSMGLMPMKLLLGTSVYSLGVLGGITSAFKSLVRGEISELTSLIYDARENALRLISDEAKQIGADDIVGTKIYMYDLGGGLLEFMAIGTAVKKVDFLKTQSPLLIPQAVIEDHETFLNRTSHSFGSTSRGM